MDRRTTTVETRFPKFPILKWIYNNFLYETSSILNKKLIPKSFTFQIIAKIEWMLYRKYVELQYILHGKFWEAASWPTTPFSCSVVMTYDAAGRFRFSGRVFISENFPVVSAIFHGQPTPAIVIPLFGPGAWLILIFNIPTYSPFELAPKKVTYKVYIGNVFYTFLSGTSSDHNATVNSFSCWCFARRTFFERGYGLFTFCHLENKHFDASIQKYKKKIIFTWTKNTQKHLKS